MQSSILSIPYSGIWKLIYLTYL